MKRRIAYSVVILIGFLVLFGHFINFYPLNDFIDNDATQWYDILASFAIILGALNLIKLQVQKVLYQRPGWGYSLVAVFGFIFSNFSFLALWSSVTSTTPQ